MPEHHVVLELLTVRHAEPLAAPAWLCLYWGKLGDLRLWTLDADGERVDHPGIDAPKPSGIHPPGREIARDAALYTGRRGELWLAWPDTSGLQIVEILTGRHEMWAAGALLPQWRRADGRLYWFSITNADPGVRVLVFRRGIDDDESEIVASVPAASYEFGAQTWHRDHAVIQTAADQVAIVHLDGAAPVWTVPLLEEGPRGIGPYAPPVLAADPYAAGTIGMTLGGASVRPGLTEGKVRVHLEGGAPTGGYYIQGRAVTGGDVDDAIDVAFNPHCRWNVAGTDAFLYPFDAPGRGRWIDPLQGPGARNNRLDERHVRAFAPYDGPGTEPHVVWPLDAWPDWST